MRISSFALPLGLILAGPLAAQDGPLGIAFVQAPEQSSGVATGRTPAEAFDRATALCVAGGATAEDCLPTNWCFPAGWSVDIFVQHVEGLHWHEVHCGLQSPELALRLAEVACNADDRPWAIECALVQVYDPEGTPQMPN